MILLYEDIQPPLPFQDKGLTSDINKIEELENLKYRIEKEFSDTQEILNTLKDDFDFKKEEAIAHYSSIEHLREVGVDISDGGIEYDDAFDSNSDFRDSLYDFISETYDRIEHGESIRWYRDKFLEECYDKLRDGIGEYIPSNVSNYERIRMRYESQSHNEMDVCYVYGLSPYVYISSGDKLKDHDFTYGELLYYLYNKDSDKLEDYLEYIQPEEDIIDLLASNEKFGIEVINIGDGEIGILSYDISSVNTDNLFKDVADDIGYSVGIKIDMDDWEGF
jgi:hypothetical protein